MPLIQTMSCTNNTPYTKHDHSQTRPHELQTNPAAKHVWFADDSAAGGKLSELKSWWNSLKEKGPLYGYFPKATKTWLIVKDEYLEEAKTMFPDVNLTTEGHRYLGSFIGKDSGMKKFMEEKVANWCTEIENLTSIATKEPQLAYAAFVYGYIKKMGIFFKNHSQYIIYIGPRRREDQNRVYPSYNGTDL